MALVRCPDCGRDVSSEAKACVGCGRPIASDVLYADPKRIVGVAFFRFFGPLRNLFVSLVITLGVVMVFWKGPEWVRDNLVVYTFFARGAAELLLAPIAIVLVCFRRTRFLGGGLLTQAGYLVGTHVWLVSLVLLRAASTFFTIFGLLAGILPVVPIAVVAGFLDGAGGMAWSLIWTSLEALVAIGLGMFIVQRDVSSRESAAAQMANLRELA